jgi:hypothetical protein
MLSSALSWLRLTICPTIAVESIGAVGSWFCNSARSRVINVLLSESALELELLDVVEDVVEPDCVAASVGDVV